MKVTKDLERNTLVIERSFDAPIEKLWRAYSDKDWFTRWWGPEGWETTVKEFAFAPGGTWFLPAGCPEIVYRGEGAEKAQWILTHP